MMKSFAALATLLLLSAAVVALPAFAPPVKAEEPAALAKSDKLSTQPVATGCSQQVWPHFETSCLRNSGTGNRISEARLIVASPSSATNQNR
ncbi:MAG TPA: hypothetical protein VGC82_06145 [Rhodopila sp.]|jgi:hypothetical protein